MASKNLLLAMEAIKAKCLATGKAHVLTIATNPANRHGVNALHTYSPRRQAQIVSGKNPTEVLFNASGKVA